MAKTALEKWREENQKNRTATNAKPNKLEQWQQENRQNAPAREAVPAAPSAPAPSATSMYGSANRTNSNLMDMTTRAKLMQAANEMADIKTRQAKALENPRASTAYTRQTERQPMQDRAKKVAEIRKDIDTTPAQSRLGKGVQSVMLSPYASIEYLGESGKQAIKNQKAYEESDLDTKLAEAYTYLMQTERAFGYGSPEYEAAQANYDAVQRELKDFKNAPDKAVDMDSRAAQFMGGVQKLQEEALEGTTGAGRFLGEAALSIGSNLSKLPLNAVVPGASLALMGAEAAAGKAYELGQQGVNAGQALTRGLVSGGIEALTEKVPLDNLVDIIKTGGKVGLMNVLKQAVTEAGEEGVAYLLNLGADKVAGDPEAEFVWNDFWKSVGMGALSGGIMGGGATAINRANAAAVGKNYQDVAPELVAEGLQMKQDTDAYRTAAEMQRKLDAGKTLSNVDVGRVVQDNEATMSPLKQAAMEMAEAEVKQRAAERTATASKSLGYGKEGARVFGEIYNGGEVDAKTLLAVFDTPYQAGLTGGDGKQYTDPMQIAAYSAGNSDRIAQQGIDAKAKPGKVFSKAESGFDYTNAPADLTQQQKNFGNLMAKTFGIKGNFVKGETAYNARYVSNVGEVNFAKDFGIDQQLMQKLGDMDFQQKVEQLANKRQQSFAFYVAHEIADHVAANRAPVEMRAFNNAMYNYLRETEGANLARERMAFYGSRGANLDTKGAIEEVAADSILMLYDGDEQKFMTAMERVLNGTDEQAKRGAKTWGDALKSIIEKLKAWARKLTGRDNAQAKADVEKSVAELERLRDMFEAAIAKAAQNVEMARAEGAKTSATATQDVAVQNSLKAGDEAATYEENGKQYSLKSLRHDITEGRMFDDLVTAKVFNQKEADLLKQNLDKLVSYMLPNAGILDMNEAYGKENRPYSAYKPNSDPLYVISLDFSTLCRKRLMTQYVIEQLQLRENRPMSAEEQIAIRSMLLDYRRQESALQVACAMCYVEAARLKAPKQMERFFNDTEAIMRKYFAKKDKAFNDKVREAQAKFKRDHGYDENATKKDMSGKDTKALNEMSARMRKEYTPDAKQQAIIDKAKSLPRSTFLTAGNLTALAIDQPDIYAAYTDHIRASTRSKSLESDIPYYYGDSEDMVSDSFIGSVNAENGMRFDSWSDFQMKHMLDMITAVIDLSVRGSKMHGYTKFPEMVRIFGKTGMMFNLSGVTEGNGFDENGDLLFSSTEGIDIVEARKLLRDFPETAGLQCIGVSDDHIRALLRADYVDYVIPYHTSGMNATLRKMAGINNWKDYTSTQHARKDPKAKKPADADKWQVEPVWSEFYVPDGKDGFDIMEKTAQRYIDLCHERGLIPKFDQFMDEPGYWKLLVDRKMVNQKTGALVEQKPVKPIFDFDLIKQEIDREVSQYDPQLEKRALKYVVDNFDAVHQRIKDLKKGHPKKPMLKMANELLQAYAEGSKAQYSMKDSEGNILSKEQQEFFKDSVVRDENGNLKRMYHGTANSGHTVFDPYGSNYGLFGQGSYFTDNPEVGRSYMGKGKTKPGKAPGLYEVYLNIKNPIDMDAPADAKAWREALPDAVLPDSGTNEQFYRAMEEYLMDEMYEKWEAAAYAMEVIEGMGYDGITHIGGGRYNKADDTRHRVYIAFQPEQIKNTTNAKPTVDPDIRFSLKGEQQMAKELKRIREEGKKAGKTAEQIRTEVAQIVGPEYAELLKTYGAIERGETPFRDIQVPERTGKSRKVSQTVRTILEAEATPDAMIPDVEALVAEGKLSYNPYSDAAAVSDAEKAIADIGWEKSLEKWKADNKDGVVSKAHTVMGWVLYNNAAQSKKTDVALDILQGMVGSQRNAAQALQATRVLKTLSPDTQLYGVQRSVADLQRELEKRYKDKAPKLKVNEALAQKLLDADGDEEQAEAMRELYQDIGKQMPATVRDRWDAWRYLAMLGNTRTHIRNILGNAVFAPVVAAKNVTATAVESIVKASGGNIQRTKSVVGGAAIYNVFNKNRPLYIGGKTTKALLKAAWDDYASVADLVSGSGKYSELKQANKHIEEGRQIFKLKWLEKARKGNSAALEIEDIWFSQAHYASALASYCKANDIPAQQIAKGGETIEKAKAYAIVEAQKATYKDMNQFSEWLSKVGRGSKSSDNAAARAFGVLMEGVLPFRKTPANILARAVEYSPIGMAKSLTVDLAKVRNAKAEDKPMLAAKAVDNFAAGFVGTALVAAGWFLAKLGLVRGRGEDDENEREFREMQGHQAYSMELGDGTSVTLDWLAPEALPFFIGVNLFEAIQKQDQEISTEMIFGALGNIGAPLLELSCLQSLNDVFEAGSYAKETAGISVLVSAATSYFTSGIPTLGGQIERIFQNERMFTYTDANNKWVPKDVQYTIGKATAKIPIPGLDYQQIPYIDAWGRTEKTTDRAKNAFDNLINPAYTSKIKTSDMEEELLRLYRSDSNEGDSILPAGKKRYVGKGDSKVDFTKEQYVQYNIERGQTAYNMLTDLVDEKLYSKATDKQRIAAVEQAYEYASQVSRKHIQTEWDKMDNWIVRAMEADEVGLSESDVLLYRLALQMANEDGNANYNQEEAQRAVEMLEGLTRKQKSYLWETTNKQWVGSKNNPYK